MLRQPFRYFNRLMLLLWRLGLGWLVNWWPAIGGQIMVLTHTGRKSGQQRRTPVNYAIVDGQIYCTVGFGAVSDWYRNLLVNPAVELWLPDGWWSGWAQEVSDEPNRLFFLRQVLMNSGFAASAAGLNPRQMSDEALAAATSDYRLVKIERKQPCTGRNGPGDLAWLWPIITFVLLFWHFGQKWVSRNRIFQAK